ncbi:hypothetical protein CPC08DRAFT_664780 [Agrocybe pediades]|nr:hypothetical protein CPC08DRAFT_664780 [Agrocybe pediades]
MSQSVRQVVVDDDDPGIVYVGPWFLDATGSQNAVGNFGPPYHETLHGTNSSASLSYSFTGTSVLVFGTNNLRNDSGILDPQWNCFVDGIEIGASSPFQFPENNWLFCSHDQLTDGPHVLSVNATVAKQQTFWIDKIHYVPSTEVSLDNQVILVDRNDPALQFDDAWTVLDVDRKITTQTNSILTFQFVGASLSWYGMIPANYPKTASKGSYSIDGGPSNMFQLQGLPPDGITNGYYQEFFQTPEYPAGTHKIVVTYLGDSQSTPLTLDYLLVQNGTLDTAPMTTSSLSSSSSSSASSSASTTHTAKRNANIGIIIGGVIGGIFLLAVIIILCLWYRRIVRLENEVEAANITARPFPYAPTSISGQSIFVTGMPQVAEGVQNTYYHPQAMQRALSMAERKSRSTARSAASASTSRT